MLISNEEAGRLDGASIHHRVQSNKLSSDQGDDDDNEEESDSEEDDSEEEESEEYDSARGDLPTYEDEGVYDVEHIELMSEHDS